LTPPPGQRTIVPITITFQARSVIDLILPASSGAGFFCRRRAALRPGAGDASGRKLFGRAIK
jgi:hypothetical protein